MIVAGMVLLAACGAARPKKAPPLPGAQSAPMLSGMAVLVLPVQQGPVPAADEAARHWPADREAVDGEIGYWLQQGTPRAKYFLAPQLDKVLARSPGLAINTRALAVSSFYRAQVKRIGDPLFGDLRRLAAVLDANIAVVPVAAEFVGPSADSAALHIATAVIDALDGDVIWFGVIVGTEKGVGSDAAIASAAQAFAQAFAPRKKPGEN